MNAGIQISMINCAHKLHFMNRDLCVVFAAESNKFKSFLRKSYLRFFYTTAC